MGLQMLLNNNQLTLPPTDCLSGQGMKPKFARPSHSSRGLGAIAKRPTTNRTILTLSCLHPFRANLGETNLNGANLSMAHLNGADLGGAKLLQADLLAPLSG
jgi:hypothetical protein